MSSSPVKKETMQTNLTEMELGIWSRPSEAGNFRLSKSLEDVVAAVGRARDEIVQNASKVSVAVEHLSVQVSAETLNESVD